MGKYEEPSIEVTRAGDGRYGTDIPSHRASRALRIGGIAGGIAGNVIAGGLREFASGRRPEMKDLVFTPANARRMADQLARMRGAAMKVGQLMSMETGDFLPPEIAAILDRLRDDADPMPPKQLKTVLTAEWGDGWLKKFRRFDVRPIAAASIGQVHRAQTKDGRDLAIKVQYPGIRRAIDSDVDNLWTLTRLSGAIPKGLDLAPLFEDIKRQLHKEADYLREAEALGAFADAMDGSDAFLVPRPQMEFSSENILAMDFIESVPFTDLASAPQATRDRAATRLIDLVLAELFHHGAMQTDPNFANYRYEPGSDRIVLLDFGATAQFDIGLRRAFHALMIAGLEGDDRGVLDGLEAVRLYDGNLPEKHRAVILEMFRLGIAAIRDQEIFDFASDPLIDRLRAKGMEIGAEKDFWIVPATDTLLVQRKVAGSYLMAARLKARVNLGEIIARYSEPF
ncbi:MAG: AarF/ABC1/UbiB kinase family protein [Pseudomonadota bacterium]